MKRFDLLKDAEGKLWLINCVLKKDRLEVGLAIAFAGLPSTNLLFSIESTELITTITIPNVEKITTSSASSDVVFDLTN